MTSATALVGYSGFVGGNLARQSHFDDQFRSTDIEDIAGRDYELLVCAGAPAEKWKANADPDADRRNLDRLTTALGRASSRRAVLISTVDVYAAPLGVHEGSPVDIAAAQPYGRHRLLLEQFFAEHFPGALVVRLPGLYGSGLKKNVIFDFLHDNMVEKIHADGIFQFYGLDRLWADIERAAAAQLALVNFATAPVSVSDIARVAFGREFTNRPTPVAARYDVRTQYAEQLGGHDGYLQSREEVLAGIATFVRSQRGPG